MQRNESFEKTLMLGKIECGRRRGMTEDEMVGWHHWLEGHELEQAPGVGDGQGSLACCSPWGRKKTWLSDWTELKMFFWNSLAFSMLQWMLAIWSLVSLPFLNPAWTSKSFIVHVLSKPDLENFEQYLLVCEMSEIVQLFNLALPFFGVGMKTDLS